ncbi:sodium:solute symporter family transporter [Gilvimarinus sp. F26214L]|uniref:sodium:solute symporter family transporter n=1 Tax=Gilvimarinus sp. DZF01 TaxID=3461371 RepID=UPI0040464090
MQLQGLDLLTLLIYLGGILAIGFYFSRRNNSTEEYFLGGRQFAGWVVGLSLVGTSISSVTFLAYPADGFKAAWLRYLPNLMLPLAAILAVWIFIPIFRRHSLTTAYEYLELRFGPGVRVYGAAAFVLAQLVRISTILYLLALLIHEVTGLDATWSVFVAGGFVALYTIVGGIDAVIWTDVLQTIVLILGGGIALAVIVEALPGGLGQVVDVAREQGKLSFADWQNGETIPLSWDMSLLNKTGTMMLVLGLVNWLTEYSSNQNVVQRYIAARSDGEARKAVWVCVLASLPIWAFYMFLGTALYVFYLQFPAPEVTEMLDGTRKAEQILPWFILRELPVGLTGIVIAAALAAAMSSLDSSINAISTVSINDIYRRFLRPGASDRHYLHVAYAVATGSSLFMIGGALYILNAETQTLQDYATILVSLFGGGLLGLYGMAFASGRFRNLSLRGVAPWIGIGATVAFTGWTIAVSQGWIDAEVPFDLYYTGIIANVVMVVGIVIAGFLLALRNRRKEPLVEGA